MKDYMLEPNYLMLSEKYIFERMKTIFSVFSQRMRRLAGVLS